MGAEPPDSGAAQKCYAAIPDDIDILVSHAPPSGYGDCLKESALKYGLERNTRVGSPELAARLESFEDIFVICGHIHEDRGRFIAQHNIVYNVSSVDGDYIPYPNRWTMLEF